MRTVAGQAGYGTGEGHPGRGELAASQPAPARGRGHLPRRRRDPRAADRRDPSAQQFPAPRPGAERADRGQPCRPRRLRRPDLPARRRNRAPDQSHLAEEMDLVARRRADRLRRARRRSSPAARPAAAPSSSARFRPASPMTARTICSTRPAASASSGRFSPEASLQSGTLRLCPRPDRRQLLPAGLRPGRDCRPRSGSAPSSARAATRSRRRGASMRAAADRCAATASSGSARATRSSTIRSAAAASPNSRSRRASAQRVRGQFRDRPVPRRAATSTPRPAKARRSALRRRHRRALPHQLRPDPGRRRHSAQPPQRRSADRRLRLARPGLLMDRGRSPRPEVEAATVRRRRRWHSRLAKWVVGLLLGLIARRRAGHGPARHRRRATASSPTGSPRWRRNSGLRIHIGRIEGSIWGETRLRDVRLYDPKGLFAESLADRARLAAARLDHQPADHPTISIPSSSSSTACRS